MAWFERATSLAIFLLTCGPVIIVSAGLVYLPARLIWRRIKH